jgi:hypothetical protein
VSRRARFSDGKLALGLVEERLRTVTQSWAVDFVNCLLK